MSKTEDRLLYMAIECEAQRQMQHDKRFGLIGIYPESRFIELDKSFYKKFDDYTIGEHTVFGKIAMATREYKGTRFAFFTMFNQDGGLL